MTAVKVVTVMGTSEDSWQAAAEEAFAQASQTIEDIRGVEVEDMTADVEDGQIQEYRSTLNIAFPVHQQMQQQQGGS